MSHRVLCVFAWTALAAGVASPQSFPADLQKYLKLTDSQAQSITDLNNQFLQYSSQQGQKYAKLSSVAQQELQKDSPDAGVVGDAYAQIEMLRRDNQAQLAQVQGKVAAVLNADQATLVNGLLEVERLQPVLSQARCVSLEPVLTIPTALQRTGDFSAIGTVGFYIGNGYCGIPPLPIALTNYLKLTDTQIALIENAIAANQDYLNRQYLKTRELQNEINDLTAAPTIDSARLGADYVAMSQITKDEATQTDQLMSTARSVLTDSQQPALLALDNANQLSATASEAVCQNILVLPADLQGSCCSLASFLLGTVTIYDPAAGAISPFPTNGCGNVGALVHSAALAQ